jgi:hypothetical protein
VKTTKHKQGGKNNTICRKIAQEKVMGFAVLRPSQDSLVTVNYFTRKRVCVSAFSSFL